jgi:hypothetical protein
MLGRDERISKRKKGFQRRRGRLNIRQLWGHLDEERRTPGHSPHLGLEYVSLKARRSAVLSEMQTGRAICTTGSRVAGITAEIALCLKFGIT